MVDTTTACIRSESSHGRRHQEEKGGEGKDRGSHGDDISYVGTDNAIGRDDWRLQALDGRQQKNDTST